MTTNKSMTIQFEQRSDHLWIAELEGGAAYRIEMHRDGYSIDYALTFVERRPSTWARRGWTPRYEQVSTHRSFERAAERAARHHRNRTKTP